MKSKREIKAFQEYLMNSWPAKHYYFLKGWILRFNDGVTSRANSVFPISYTGTQKTLDADITIVEDAYKKYGLPPIFTMHEFHEPKNLKDKLLDRGYHVFDHTRTLGIEMENVQVKMNADDLKYSFHDTRVNEISAFLSMFTKRNEKEQEIIQQINYRITVPKKCYILTKHQNDVIGTLFAVLTPQRFLYVGNVLVHPDFRRQNIATNMLIKLINEWGRLKGVKVIWLQVEKNNIGALTLYEKFGMEKIYDYYYMKKE